MARPRAIVQSLDEIEADATVTLRDCYVEATPEQADRYNDGKPFYIFSLAQTKGWGNVDGESLTRALEKARKAERTLQRLGDATPEEARAALDEVEDLRAQLAEARKGNKAASDWEKQKADLVTAHQTEIKKAREEAAKIREELDGRVKMSEARTALVTAGFSKHVDLMLPVVVPMLEYQPPENGSPGRTRVMREDRSTERLDPSTGAPLTPLQLAKELAADKRYEILLDGDGATGGGLTGGADAPASPVSEKGPAQLDSIDDVSKDLIDQIAERSARGAAVG